MCRFHHIKSLTKRKHILEWGKELRLAGYSKPGYPGKALAALLMLLQALLALLFTAAVNALLKLLLLLPVEVCRIHQMVNS